MLGVIMLNDKTPFFFILNFCLGFVNYEDHTFKHLNGNKVIIVIIHTKVFEEN